MKIHFDAVVHLLHNASSGALATQSTHMPGYPFASILPFVLDERHRPIFLISGLAEHTKNVIADPRASLLVANFNEPNILAGERLSLIGDVERFEVSAELIARAVRYQPDMEQYLALGDFAFFRLIPKRARYIAGFGQMGWVEESEWGDCAFLSLADEVGLIHEHQSPHVRLLGLDCYGFDTECNGKRERQRFPAAPVATEKIGEVVKRFLAAM
jgi:heme oxygenase (biliverdin-IX-beta and delta-forming)